ncbi:MAG: tetratricopeptide repeat protein, partial [Thermomicrobiales bacterium]|nr:tetratricopeptide repeat protein [Thermomicrobiales bacterium]
RLLAAGYGGQMLLSTATRALAAEQLPAGAALRDLGRHRLRDLLEPEVVWQLVVAGLPDTFPPLKTLERSPTNLPMQSAPLLGRETDLAALRPLATDPATRLLTLAGPGGVGKTRLALQLAADVLDAFPDGAFFVDLAAMTDPDLLLPQISSVLGVREGGGLAGDAALLAFLAPTRLVLILDNLEQFRPLEAMARQVATLLAAAPGLIVLATSRSPLRLRAEREWLVGPLALPDPRRLPPLAALAEIPAVTLFLERAHAARPGFALTAGNAEAIAELCVRLDGLPLAIELAAARARVLTPAAILERMGRTIDLLVGRETDRPDRQRTLRAAIDWSHDLLTADQQVFFRRLGVFAGGMTLEAIEAVADALGEPRLDALDAVSELLEESLIRAEETPDGEMRYRLLVTLRAYAHERLEASDELAAAHDAHLDWFAHWAKTTYGAFHGGGQVAWLERCEAEQDNFRAALGWGLERGSADRGLGLAIWIWRFWQLRGHLSEGRRWLERCLAAADASPRMRADALDGLSVLTIGLGDLAGARVASEAAIALWREVDDPLGVSVALVNLGNVFDRMGQPDRAEAAYLEALALGRTAGDQRRVAVALGNLALIEMGRGATDRAQLLLEESLAIKRTNGDRAGMANTLTNLAILHVDLGNLARAATLLEECLAIDRELDNPSGIGDDLGNLAAVAVMRGDVVTAARWHREALELRQRLGDWGSIAYSLETIGQTATAAGMAEPGARLLGAAERLREELGAPVPAGERERYQDGLTQTRAALDAERFAAAWAAGRALTREQMVEEALALAARVGGQDVVIAADAADDDAPEPGPPPPPR